MSSSNTSPQCQFSNTRGRLFHLHLLYSVPFHHFTAFFSARASLHHFYWCSYSTKGLRARAKAFSSSFATPRHKSWLTFAYIDSIFANLHVSLHLPFVHIFLHSARSVVSSCAVFHFPAIQEDPQNLLLFLPRPLPNLLKLFTLPNIYPQSLLLVRHL